MAKKTVTDDIVNAVINGDYGTGEAQEEALTKEGYDYGEIQQAVSNRIANSGGTTAISPDASAATSGAPKISGSSISYSSSGKPIYTNLYANQIDEINNQLLNLGPFTYDYTTDDTYKQYEKEYTRQGERAMKDTLGQVSMRTGGLASSYAESAAQQQYGSYMAELADKIPELKQTAYNMYLNEENTLRNNLSALLALEQNEFSHYQNELADWYNQQELELQRQQLAAQYAAAQAAQANNTAIEKGFASMTDLNTLNALATQGQYQGNMYYEQAKTMTPANAQAYLEGLVDKKALSEDEAYAIWLALVEGTDYLTMLENRSTATRDQYKLGTLFRSGQADVNDQYKLGAL